MSNFKLIAIRPLKGCDKKYSKVLTPGEIYSFYQGYRFLNARGTQVSLEDEVMAFEEPKGSRLNIHDVETADGHSLNVNISAIVGKNGTGKSTLIDMLFAVTYLASMSKELLRDGPSKLRKELELLPNTILEQKQHWQEALDKQEQLRLSFNNEQQNQTGHRSNFDKLVGQADLNEQEIIAQKQILDSFIVREQKVRRQLEEMQKMAQNCRAEIFYLFNQSVYCLRTVATSEGDPGAQLFKLSRFTPESKLQKSELLDLSTAIEQQNFFYTLAINYSHYALNEVYLGQWINSLFHKNDGYKTPIVINPMRDKGVFDINRELLLGKYRLLSNLLIQRKLTEPTRPIFITDQLHVNQICFSVNKNKVENIRVRIDEDGLQGEIADSNLMQDIFAVYFGNDRFEKNLPHHKDLVNLTLNYILKKVQDIRKYDGLKNFNFTPERSENNRKFLEKLREESSHIVFKLNQAIHFLKRAADPQWIDLFKLRSGNNTDSQPTVYKATLPELLDWAGNPDGHQIINFLPPAIFNIDIELKGGKSSESFFHELSSGEQQIINTIQTVLYHLNNLQSVRYSKLPRCHYRAINLVFDEIELYFHPAYQRSFINELLKALHRMFVGPGHAIETINILFLTHSPFILSDIPKSQITLLSVDENSGQTVAKAPESETFAANINDLLAGSFFLDGTLMGVLAERKVNEIIEASHTGNGLSVDQERVLELIGDSYLRNSVKYFLARHYDKDRNR